MQSNYYGTYTLTNSSVKQRLLVFVITQLRVTLLNKNEVDKKYNTHQLKGSKVQKLKKK